MNWPYWLEELLSLRISYFRIHPYKMNSLYLSNVESSIKSLSFYFKGQSLE